MRIKKILVRLFCCAIPVAKWRRAARSYLMMPIGLRDLNEEKFFEYINGKTVAVVGNGPQQVGKHTGAEIDSADIVVRFNTFELDGYIDDYGSRTDVWVNACGNEYKERKYVDLARSCKYVIWRCVPFGFIYEKKLMRFFRRVRMAGGMVNVLPFCRLYECTTKPIFGNLAPTIGCLFLWYIKTYAKPKKINIYGFSFLDDISQSGKLQTMPHFYHKRETGGTHDMSIEVDFLRDVFKNEIQKGMLKCK